MGENFDSSFVQAENRERLAQERVRIPVKVRMLARLLRKLGYKCGDLITYDIKPESQYRAKLVCFYDKVPGGVIQVRAEADEVVVNSTPRRIYRNIQIKVGGQEGFQQVGDEQYEESDLETPDEYSGNDEGPEEN